MSPDSPWRANTLYMAHFIVSDIAEGAFHDHERLSRGAMGLAGAEPGTLRLWLDDWSATPVAPEGSPMRLRAAEGEVAIDLRLARGKPPVPQGDRGLSQKSAEPGNASYYYSLTRMPTEGVVTVGRERFTVSGLCWMDREWSTRAADTATRPAPGCGSRRPTWSWRSRPGSLTRNWRSRSVTGRGPSRRGARRAG